MRFWEGKVLGLTPDLGDRLAEAFSDETGLPREIRRAVAEDGDVRLSTLEEWGRKAHLSAEPGRGESRCIGDRKLKDRIALDEEQLGPMRGLRAITQVGVGGDSRARLKCSTGRPVGATICP